MKNSSYLHYVHSFRGFAILNIVAIHAIAFAMVVPADFVPDTTTPLWVFNETLFHDSTLYFALISGLLFSSVLAARGFQRFYRSKLLYVVSPYVFCTVVFSLARWNSQGTGLLALPSGTQDYLASIWPNLLRGEAQFTYWYIPVLLFLFAVTPLLSRLSAAKGYAAAIVWLIMLSPLAFSRPEFSEGVAQVSAGTLIYFGGAYMVGLYIGQNLEARLDVVARWRMPLLALAIVTTVALAGLQFAGINRFGSFSLQESLFYVQKLCLAAIVLLWLRSRLENQPRWLTVFANEAFSIYFLHIFFIILLGDLFWVLLRDPHLQPLSIYLAGPAYFAFAIAMSMLLIHLLRALLGRHSRLLVGS